SENLYTELQVLAHREEYAAARAAQAVAQERERCARICDSAADVSYAWWKARADPNDQGAAHKAEELADAIRAGSPSPQPAPAGWPAREVLADTIRQGLHGTYHCGRVWSAWHVGTMSEDDFSPVDESDTPEELADSVLALLAAAPQPPSAWRPIEEAPRDGTTVLLAAPGRVTAGDWHAEQWPTASEYHGSTGEYLGQYETGECVPAGWYSWDGGFTDENPPTHWQPLPPPPSAGEEKT
ncbi:MAG: hypothetical protein MUE35_13690, partial [Hydrogenophaga sp.]|nr:hypothetical protein [Hydrogenophaga sp.]